MNRILEGWGNFNAYAWAAALVGLITTVAFYMDDTNQQWIAIIVLLSVHASQLAQTLLSAFLDSRQQ